MEQGLIATKTLDMVVMVASAEVVREEATLPERPMVLVEMPPLILGAEAELEVYIVMVKWLAVIQATEVLGW